MATVIGSLLVTLGLNSAAFETGAKRAQASGNRLQSSMGKVAAGIAGAFAGLQIVDLARQFRDMTVEAINFAGGIGEVAQQLGVSTKSLQEYRYAATQVGLSAEEMDQGLAQLTRRLGEAAQGSKAPAEALDRLGISLDRIKGADAGDVIPLIAAGMASIPDPAQRAAIAVDLFGKSGQKLMPLLSEGAGGVEKLRSAAHKLGIVLSEETIKNADEVADKLAGLNMVVKAQENAALLDNADAVLAYEEGLSKLKIALIGAGGEFAKWIKQVSEGSWVDKLGAALTVHDTLWANSAKWPAIAGQKIGTAIREFTIAAVRWIGEMVTKIRDWITSKLGAVWDAAGKRIEQVKGWFAGLYDAVVGHSYIPDMVAGIAAEMAKLQSVMVDPALRATEDTGAAFRTLAGDVEGLLERLFPAAAALNRLRDEAATLDRGLAAGLISPGLAGEAKSRLTLEANPQVGEGIAGGIRAALGAISDAHEKMTAKTEVLNVRVSKSFADAAEATVSALQRMTNAIKGGNFLDILGAVVGLGVQLGGIGLFGKKMAATINAPRYASGTNFHPGGLAVVGERGPELVDLPRGSRVFPNGSGPGGVVNNYYTLPSDEFWARVDGRAGQAVASAAPSLIAAGGANGMARMQRMQSRSLA